MGFIRERKLKTGAVRYQAEIRLKGHPMLTAGFDRKSDAKSWIQKTEADIRCGRHQLYAEGRRHTFADAVDRYSKEQPISTAKRGHLEWWKRELGALYIQDVRPAIIAEKKQRLLKEPNPKGKIRTPSTVNRFLATLSHLLSVCMKQWEWIGENPVKKISREREPRGRTRFLSPEERTRLLEACRNSKNPQLYLFVVLLLVTGCRYNEVRWLKWTDIDLAKGRITLIETKNSETHTVTLCGKPLALLREHAAVSNSIGYIFPGNTKTAPTEFRRSIRTAIREAGLREFRPHDVRHTFCTELLSEGLSLGEIGRLVNHKSVATTRRYAYLIESRGTEAVSKLSEKIFEESGNA